MIHKEKADGLIDNFLSNSGMILMTRSDAKYCALIAVEEIKKALLGSSTTILDWQMVEEELQKS